MKSINIVAVVTGALACVHLAQGHDYFVEAYAPAGYTQDLALRVTHGCKGSPVREVHVKIPEDVGRVTVEYNRAWKIETKMRKLPHPIQSEGGMTYTETVDEIIWKDPVSALPGSGMFNTFLFRAALPKTVGKVLWFKTYQVCEQGGDKYVSVPKTEMNSSQPDFVKAFHTFMYSLPGPAPSVVLTKPDRPQYPWEPSTVATTEPHAPAPATN